MKGVASECQNCILMLEHDVFREALTEWAGFDSEHAMEDLSYLCGVNDFVDLSIRRVLEGVEDESITEN